MFDRVDPNRHCDQVVRARTNDVRGEIASGIIQKYSLCLLLDLSTRLVTPSRDDFANVKFWLRTLAQVANQHTSAGRFLMRHSANERTGTVLLGQKFVPNLLCPVPDPLLSWRGIPIRVD
jgi:hypothetical protein